MCATDCVCFFFFQSAALVAFAKLFRSNCLLDIVLILAKRAVKASFKTKDIAEFISFLSGESVELPKSPINGFTDKAGTV